MGGVSKKAMAVIVGLAVTGLLCKSIFAGTDSFNVKDSNDKSMFIVQDDGKVGIGTTNPLYLLHVSNGPNSSQRGIVSAYHDDTTGAPLIHYYKSRGSEAAPLLVQQGDYLGNLAALAWDPQFNTYVRTAQMSFLTDGPTQNGVIPTAIKFQTGSITSTNTSTLLEGMRISSSGNVGIGTTSPLTKIHVHVPTDADGTSPPNIALYTPKNVAFTAEIQNSSVQSDFVVADTTSTVGYRGAVRGVRARGTLAFPEVPQPGDYTFSAIGAIWDGTAVRNAADISFVVDGPVSENVTPQRIAFRTRTGGTGYSEKMTIKDDGKIGIGTISPSQQLEVNGGVRLNTTAARPVCDASARGTIWMTQDAGNQNDTVSICGYKSGALDWHSLPF